MCMYAWTCVLACKRAWLAQLMAGWLAGWLAGRMDCISVRIPKTQAPNHVLHACECVSASAAPLHVCEACHPRSAGRSFPVRLTFWDLDPRFWARGRGLVCGCSAWAPAFTRKSIPKKGSGFPLRAFASFGLLAPFLPGGCRNSSAPLCSEF